MFQYWFKNPNSWSTWGDPMRAGNHLPFARIYIAVSLDSFNQHWLNISREGFLNTYMAPCCIVWYILLLNLYKFNLQCWFKNPKAWSTWGHLYQPIAFGKGTGECTGERSGSCGPTMAKEGRGLIAQDLL